MKYIKLNVPLIFNRELLITWLEREELMFKIEGYIPTLKILIEELKEEELKVEAKRLVANDKSQS